MARQKRYNRKKNLLNVPVLIEETGITSKYFQVYDVPEELPMGKSSFLIGGSQLLVGQIKLQIEKNRLLAMQEMMVKERNGEFFEYWVRAETQKGRPPSNLKDKL